MRRWEGHPCVCAFVDSGLPGCFVVPINEETKRFRIECSRVSAAASSSPLNPGNMNGEAHIISFFSTLYTKGFIFNLQQLVLCLISQCSFLSRSLWFHLKSPNKIQKIVKGSTETNEWERVRWSERERERDLHTTASAHGTQHTGDTTSTRTSSLIVRGVYRAPCLALCLAYIGSGGFF